MKMKEKKQFKKTTIIIISILLLSFTFSCKKDAFVESENKKKSTQTTAFVKFVFPDTVYINGLYKGEIKYKGVLDTITLNVLEEVNGKDRYITYSLTKTKNINYETKQLYKIKLDTFGAIDNRTIPIYGIKFTELGVHYIDGIINDHITIDTLTNSKSNTDKVRYIENVVRATHKVVVIENPNPDRSDLQ